MMAARSFTNVVRRAAGRVPVVVHRSRPPTWNPCRRMKVALANNNLGTWYICLSRRTVADIERKFQEGSVASILFKTVGGVLGDHRVLKHDGSRHYLYVQLSQADWAVDIALADLGIERLHTIKLRDIRHY